MMNLLRRNSKPAENQVNFWDNPEPKGYGWRYSRFIASFRNAGGTVPSKEFRSWLEHLGLSRDEIADIWELSFCGACELENDARSFLGTDNPFHGIA